MKNKNNSQQVRSNSVQDEEVGATIKKDETHKSSFSSSADTSFLSKEIEEVEKELEYYCSEETDSDWFYSKDDIIKFVNKTIKHAQEEHKKRIEAIFERLKQRAKEHDTSEHEGEEWNNDCNQSFRHIIYEEFKKEVLE